MDENKLEFISEPDRTSFRRLIDRCERAKIRYLLHRPWSTKKTPSYALRVYLQSGDEEGDEEREVIVLGGKEADRLNGVDFEKYVFIQGYEAICSYDQGVVEAYVKILTPLSVRHFLSTLRNPSNPWDVKNEDHAYSVQVKAPSVKTIAMTLSHPSVTISALTRRESEDQQALALRITGLSISTNKEAHNLLERLANSLFFEIQYRLNIPLMLQTNYERPSLGVLLDIRSKKPAGKGDLGFPRLDYDIEPLKRYWYAQSAYGMPLLQFLAYYQVLEYYFLSYYNAELQREVTNILRGSPCEPHVSDVNKVISVVRSKMGGGHPDERKQLIATILGCVADSDVWELVEEYAQRKYFKAAYNRILRDKDKGIREQLAEHIYDIRCQIVHAKSEEPRRILPFSQEESLLQVELPIMEFFARKAIIANSKKMVL